MFTSSKLLKTIACGAALTLVGALVPAGVAPVFDGAAWAQENERPKPRKTKKAYVMSLAFNRPMEKVREAFEAEDYATAKAELLKLKKKKGAKEFDLATLDQYLAMIAFEEEDTQGAIGYYREIASFTDIPEYMRDGAIYALAQLYYSVEQYEQSLQYLRRWFDLETTTPNAQHYVFRGQTLYTLERYQEAIPDILQAINMTKESGEPVKENWWQILMSAYYSLDDFQKVKEVLTVLALKFPKPTYWHQLAGIYGELGMEKEQMGLMELSYRQGYFEKETHYEVLSQLYLINGAPYRSAQLMKEGFEKGVVSEEDYKNFELLSIALTNAQELEDAIPELEKAADLADDGELYQRIGLLYLQVEDWENCVSSMDKAVELGIDDEEDALMILGNCQFSQYEFDEARKTFRRTVTAARANKNDQTMKNAQKWIKVIDQEQRRYNEIVAEGLMPAKRGN
ncbi:MAG: CDC27 family protein [Sphingomonadales bacterium]|nr:CDC27 family protein [Sphingomonadales bacterium]